MSRDLKSWAKCYFSSNTKYNVIQNNICASFNSYIKEGRDMPILSMIKWIRKNLMKRHLVKYTAMLRYMGQIYPNVQDKLEQLKMECKNYFCTPAGDAKY